MNSIPSHPPAVRRSLVSRAVESMLVGLVRLYQWCVSPLLVALLGSTCRYEPSCSQYMVLALRKHGPVRGLIRGLGRLARCHPWGGSGFDPP